MRAVIQRVNKAKVVINNTESREISRGIVIFVAITHTDTEKDAKWLSDKCVNLRIFPKDNNEDKFDKSVLDIKGDILVISQFTLYGDCNKGRRPDFINSAKPEYAELLYESFIKFLKEYGLNIITGKFKTHMDVELHNDGPVTLIIDTKS